MQSMLESRLGRYTLLCFLIIINSCSSFAVTKFDDSSKSDSSTIQLGGRAVETRVSAKGIRVSIYDTNGNLVRPTGLRGEVHLNVGKKAYDFELQQTADATAIAVVDLAKTDGYDLELKFQLSSKELGKVVYSTTLRLPELRRDEFLMKLQGTCPVSGKVLDPAQKPPKLVFEGKPLFVCCNGCAAAVNKYPARYLAIVYAGQGRELRPGVYQATLADADAIAEQKTCPVLDESLDILGVPQKVEVDGKTVFISCVGCAKFLQADPAKYLTKLAENGIAPPTWR